MISLGGCFWRRWLFHFRSVIRQQFQLGHSAIELLHQRLNAFTAKSVHQHAVCTKERLVYRG